MKKQKNQITPQEVARFRAATEEQIKRIKETRLSFDILVAAMERGVFNSRQHEEATDCLRTLAMLAMEHLGAKKDQNEKRN